MLEVIASVEHDLVLHLGDCVADARCIEAQFPSTRLRYIAGNDLQKSFFVQSSGNQVLFINDSRYKGIPHKGFVRPN